MGAGLVELDANGIGQVVVHAVRVPHNMMASDMREILEKNQPS